MRIWLAMLLMLLYAIRLSTACAKAEAKELHAVVRTVSGWLIEGRFAISASNLSYRSVGTRRVFPVKEIIEAKIPLASIRSTSAYSEFIVPMSSSQPPSSVPYCEVQFHPQPLTFISIPAMKGATTIVYSAAAIRMANIGAAEDCAKAIAAIAHVRRLEGPSSGGVARL